MQNTKEVRTILFDDKTFKTLEAKFRPLCALNDETLGEAFSRLMLADIESNKEKLADKYVSQSELLDALKAKNIMLSRQTLLSHRTSGVLPKDYFAESKLDSDSPNANKNQRTYYNLKKCVRFYEKREKEN